MEKKIVVLIDSSGSFFENGKRGLQTYLIDAIYHASKTIFHQEAEISFFTWAESVIPYEPYEKINFGGNANLDSFREWLLKIEEHTEIILLSDGNFRSEPDDLYLLAKNRNIRIIAFAVGADASRGTLALFSEWHKVQNPDSVLNVIRKLCCN